MLEVPTGVIADLYSRRWSLVLGCLFLGCAMLLVGSFPTFTVIAAAQLVSALGYTCLSGAQEAWLADELGEERLGPLLPCRQLVTSWIEPASGWERVSRCSGQPSLLYGGGSSSASAGSRRGRRTLQSSPVGSWR